MLYNLDLVEDVVVEAVDGPNLARKLMDNSCLLSFEKGGEYHV